LSEGKVEKYVNVEAWLGFHSASSLEEESLGRHDAPLGTHYPDSKPTSILNAA